LLMPATSPDPDPSSVSLVDPGDGDGAGDRRRLPVASPGSPASHADEALPEGAVVDGAALARPFEEGFDFVVIGSGAAGAVAAHTLAAAGHAVAIVEEGPWVKTAELAGDTSALFRRLTRDAGAQVMEGRSFVPLLQGRCVGGSTVINSAIAWRTPDDVLDDWRARFGVPLAPEDLAPHFDAIEADLSAREVDDDVLGESNRAFLASAAKLGITASKMRRYDRGCRGSGRCLTGCPTAAKQGMNVSYVPSALARGARIVTSARAVRVETRGARAVGVVAKARSGAEVRLAARHGVVVAASAVQTPNLLRRSGLRKGGLGDHFQVHPGVALAGRFDAPMDMDFGATQGAESVHFRASRRFKLETIAMPPELVAARTPGLGAALVDRLADYRRVAVWGAHIRARAEGTVRPAWGGGDRVRLTLGEDDVRVARDACATIAELLFAAGAREVWPGIHGVPPILTSPDQVRLVREGPVDPRAYSFIATHLFGAARMGPDPRTSVVGLDFATHEVSALYVVDSSVFPTNLGVNPQHSIMAVARLAASRIAASARGARVA